MFDLRYHVASIAAVFLALAIGIVIGVAIASGGKLEDATQGVLEDELASARQQLDEAEQRAESLESRDDAVRRLLDEAYGPIMAARLSGLRIGVLYLGPDDVGLSDDIGATLSDAGNGELQAASVTALELPLALEEITTTLVETGALPGYESEEDIGLLGEALGLELVSEGDKVLWEQIKGALAAQQTGSAPEPLDGVVVVRSWRHPDVSNPVERARSDRTEDFLDGLLQGLAQGDAIVVGVEAQDVDPEESAVESFQEAGFSTVTGIDGLPGRIGLALLLAGGEPGSYGLGQDRIAPPLESIPTETAVA
jgi:Copper transport outer membrane protein, MctB